MKYKDGQEVHAWDRVQAWPGCRAIVVFSIDTDEFTKDFPKDKWGYLERGVMLDTEQAGLVHLSESDDELTLVSRGGQPTDDEIAELRDAQRRYSTSQESANSQLDPSRKP